MSNMEKVSLTSEVFFEVRNAKIYGGEGSIGYGSVSTKRTAYKNMLPEEFFTNTYVEEMRKGWATMCGVPVENVRVISEEEYHFFTDDEDE